MNDPQISPVPRHGRNRILLVDDDPVVRDSLAAVLEAEGYAVMQAEDGQRALDLVCTTPVDLALLDLNMPRKSGWEAFGCLSSQFPMLPAVLITARPGQLFTAMGAGVAALLEKPLDIPILLDTITNLLAEPAETRLKRVAGRSTDFYFNSGHAHSLTRPAGG